MASAPQGCQRLPTPVIHSNHYSPDILEFILLLTKYKVNFVLVGGEAVIFYGFARLTGDVDFFYDSKKMQKDFMTNTEKYHTGFSASYLREMMEEFSVYDLRKPRLKQEFKHPLFHRAIDIFPSSLLFLPVETNLWCLVKNGSP